MQGLDEVKLKRYQAKSMQVMSDDSPMHPCTHIIELIVIP